MTTSITAATGLARHAWLGLFKLVGFEVMLLEQIVKVGAILASQFSGVTNVAFGEG